MDTEIDRNGLKSIEIDGINGNGWSQMKIHGIT